MSATITGDFPRVITGRASAFSRTLFPAFLVVDAFVLDGTGRPGGELFIFDPKTEVPAKLHGKSVTVIECSHVDYEWMHPLLHQYFARTGSRGTTQADGSDSLRW